MPCYKYVYDCFEVRVVETANVVEKVGIHRELWERYVQFNFEVIDMKEYGFLNNESNEIIAEFMKFYSLSSIPQYRAAITRYCECFNVKSIREITSDQFLSFSDKNLYIEWFIKYLYAYDRLFEENGFPSNWHKDDIFEHFQNRLKPKRKESLKEIILTTDLISNIENRLLDIDEDSNDFIWVLAWYMLFNTDIRVDELKNTDCKNFDGVDLISSQDNRYFIPQKYRVFISRRMERKEYTKFQQLNKYIKLIGEMVGINNLTPGEVKRARDRNMLMCPNCSSINPAKDEYWFIVNGRIVCTDCAANNEKKN